MPDLRRKILDASIALVAEQGVRQVSFREVARRAGVSHQAPYHHFGNHQGILRAIAKEGFQRLADDMQGAAGASGGDATASLTAAGHAYVRFARDHAGHFRVMFQQALVDVHDPVEPLEEAACTKDTLVGLAAAAAEDAGLPPDTLSHLCWCTVHGLATLLVEGVLAPEDDEALARQVVAGMEQLLRRG